MRGLGQSQVQKILARHGIERVLAAEGGRTSRGMLGDNQDENVATIRMRTGGRDAWGAGMMVGCWAGGKGLGVGRGGRGRLAAAPARGA